MNWPSYRRRFGICSRLRRQRPSHCRGIRRRGASSTPGGALRRCRAHRAAAHYIGVVRVLGIPVATLVAIVGIAYTLILIALTIWWRPGWRRLGALMCGTLAAALVGALIEGVAHRAGLWRYPMENDTPIGPLPFFALGMHAF